MSRWGVHDFINCLESVTENGNGWKAKCPFHNDLKASLSVAVGKSGSILVNCHAGCDRVFDRVVEMMGGEKPKLSETKSPRKKSVQITPADNEDYPKTKRDPVNGTWTLRSPSAIWEYRGLDGQLHFITCRFETEDGKEFRPCTYRQNPETGAKAWWWAGPDAPTTLYRLNHFNADNPTYIVEGEKAADALATALPDVNVITWWGGAQNAHKADWAKIAGSVVTLWPDADEPGVKAMETVASILIKLGCSVLVCNNIIEAAAKHNVPSNIKGFDAADAVALGWDIDKIAEFINDAADCKQHTIAVVYTNTPTETIPTAQVSVETAIANVTASVERKKKTDSESLPFLPLGYNKGNYYYMSRTTRQVHILSESAHKKSNLLSIVSSRQFWEGYCPSMSKKPGADWDGCEERMKDECHKFGIFDETLIRGRGAWFDKGKVVLHLGDKLVINGVLHDIGFRPGKFIYELAGSIEVGGSEPLSSDEAALVYNIAQMLSWEKDIYAVLLAGWCVLAPVCGVLNHRPHIWITGGSGSGKSTVEKDFIRPLLSNTAIVVQGGSTEAGIRQKLKQDALPVIIDEAESENEKNRNQMQSILELMRQASTESESEIFKGTTGGRAQTFKIRSMFVLASIGVAVKQQADQNRISILSLVRNNNAEHYRAIQAELAKITPEYASRLISRTISLIPVIRHNAEKFAVEIGKYTGSRRIGDQYGTLMAGFMSLYYDRELTDDIIKAESKRFEQSLISIPKDGDDDEWQCLNYILQHFIKVDRSGSNSVTISIGELLYIIYKDKSSAGVNAIDARHALRRYGIAFEYGWDSVKIGCGHTQITNILKNTPWANGWKRFLERIPGAQKPTEHKVSFAGIRLRAIAIPIDVILGKEDFFDDK